MEKIYSSLQFDECIQTNALLLVYFSGKSCGVCASLKPKIENLVLAQYKQVKLLEVPTEEALELAARFHVFSVPVILFFIEGREYLREARIISVQELDLKLSKIIDLYEE